LREENKKILIIVYIEQFSLVFVTFLPLYLNIFHLGETAGQLTDVVEYEEDLRTLSSRLRAPDFDANNLPPLMTEEKQCAGFNTGSESGLRSCVVGGPLNQEKNDSSSIERATGATSFLGFTISRRAGGSIGSYENAIGSMKMHAHQNLCR